MNVSNSVFIFLIRWHGDERFFTFSRTRQNRSRAQGSNLYLFPAYRTEVLLNSWFVPPRQETLRQVKGLPNSLSELIGFEI